MLFAGLWFTLSVLLTGIFISSRLWLFYMSTESMMISLSIAGGKWLIQIIAALIFLKEKKWEFIKRIGFVCFVGSCLLFLYIILFFLPLKLGSASLFVLSIAVSVLVMVVMYYNAVKKTNLPVKWFWGWMLSLAIAVILQIKWVFQ
jgi:hypothetical protein